MTEEIDLDASAPTAPSAAIAPGTAAATGDELEDALTIELGRTTGQVPAIEVVVLDGLAG